MFGSGKQAKVLYRIHGRERDQLAMMQQQLVAQQAAFYGLAKFIAEREGLDLQATVFNDRDLCFERRPPAPAVEPKPA